MGISTRRAGLARDSPELDPFPALPGLAEQDPRTHSALTLRFTPRALRSADPLATGRVQCRMSAGGEAQALGQGAENALSQEMKTRMQSRVMSEHRGPVGRSRSGVRAFLVGRDAAHPPCSLKSELRSERGRRSKRRTESVCAVRAILTRSRPRVSRAHRKICLWPGNCSVLCGVPHLTSPYFTSVMS